MSRSHSLLHVLSILTVCTLSVGATDTIPPPYVPDATLACSPIIVVGKWNKAPLREGLETKERQEYANSRTYPVWTELLVERVIKGDLKPGAHKLLLGLRIGWAREDGGPVMSYMSTEMMGDVKEVADSNLWFLSPRTAADASDKTAYVALETYRGVQPVVLEQYFLALGSKDPRIEVPKLLVSDDPLVIARVLGFVSGDAFPWPFGLSEWEAGKRPARGEPLRDRAPAVERLLTRKDAGTRRLAAAVYADLAGPAATPRLRDLLRDPDGTVRAVAAGILIRRRDRDVGPALPAALRGLNDPTLACQVIDELRQWGDPAAVPVLIEFLQDDSFAYMYGDDFGVPALKAQEALKQLTGHEFPLDVAASRTAWEKAAPLADPKDRATNLAKVLPWDPQPLAADLRREAKGPVLVLTNRTKQPLTITKKPGDISYRWTNGVGGGGTGHRDDVTKDDFIILKPGESLPILLQPDYADAATLTNLTVAFLNNGHEVGHNAWIGKISLSIEPKP